MPLSRSNTRAHSPAPPASYYPPSPRPPNFLPPSHYAAAGGFSFLSRHAQQSSTESDGVYRPVEAPSSPDIYMPVSQPDSDSSFEFQPRSEKRFTMMSSKNKLNRRESQMMNLPMVETQLLPSLRDTIDRMTRPPSRAASSHTTPSPAQLSVKSFHVERTLSPSMAPSSPRSRPVTPQPPCPSPMEEPMTPKAKQGAPKPVLKSALRAPTPKLSRLKSTASSHRYRLHSPEQVLSDLCAVCCAESLQRRPQQSANLLYQNLWSRCVAHSRLCVPVNYPLAADGE